MSDQDFILKASPLKGSQLNKLVNSPSIYSGNTAQFPGQQFLNMDVTAIRNYIKRQKRAKGYRFSNAVGSNPYNINISGNAKIFLGFAYENFSGTISQEMTLQINNEVIIDGVNPEFFSQNFTDNEYYFFPRPLSGSDNILITLNNSAVGVDTIVIYYM